MRRVHELKLFSFRLSKFFSGVARTFAAKGRAVNEVELGSSYSHYPTSDTRTEEGEASYETNSLTGPGLSNRGSSARGRIWETETYDDGRKGQNRVGGNLDFDFMHPSSTLVSTSTSISPASFVQGKGKEHVYQSSSPKRTSRSAELSVPISQAREGKEDSYSSTSAIATLHRSREDGSIAGASTSSNPSNTLPSISRVEGNSSTPSVPRARNKSVSGSSSASVVTPVSMFVDSLSLFFFLFSFCFFFSSAIPLLGQRKRSSFHSLSPVGIVCLKISIRLSHS